MKIYASFGSFSNTAIINKENLPGSVALSLPDGYAVRMGDDGFEVTRDDQPADEPPEIVVKTKEGYAVSDSRIDPATGLPSGYIQLTV